MRFTEHLPASRSVLGRRAPGTDRATVTVMGNTLRFSFAIPQGVKSPPGEAPTQQPDDAVAERAHAIPGISTLEQPPRRTTPASKGRAPLADK